MFSAHGNIECDISFILSSKVPEGSPHSAAARGDLDELERLLMINPYHVNSAVHLWYTPLHYAICHDKHDITQNLLAKLSLTCENCVRALCLAILKGDSKAVNMILSERPQVFYIGIDYKGGGVLHWIIRVITEHKLFSQDCLRLVETVLKKAHLHAFHLQGGANFSPSSASLSPLQYAIHKGGSYIVNLILQHQPMILELLDTQNSTILHWIIDVLSNPTYQQPHPMNRIAIEVFEKASLNALSTCNNYGNTPLYEAVLKARLDIIDCILEHKQEVLAIPNQHGNAPCEVIMMNKDKFTQEQSNAADRVLKKAYYQVSFVSYLMGIHTLAADIYQSLRTELDRYIVNSPTFTLRNFILLVHTIQYNSSLIRNFVPKRFSPCDESKLNLFIEMVRENSNELVKDAIVKSTVALQDKAYVVGEIVDLISNVVLQYDELEKQQHIGLMEKLLSLSETDAYNIQGNILYPYIYVLLIKYGKDDSLHHPHNKQNTERIIDYFIEHSYIHGAKYLLKKLTDYYLTNSEGAKEILKKLSDFYSANPNIILDSEIKNKLLNATKKTDRSRRGRKRDSSNRASNIMAEVIDIENNAPSSSVLDLSIHTRYQLTCPTEHSSEVHKLDI